MEALLGLIGFGLGASAGMRVAQGLGQGLRPLAVGVVRAGMAAGEAAGAAVAAAGSAVGVVASTAGNAVSGATAGARDSMSDIQQKAGADTASEPRKIEIATE